MFTRVSNTVIDVHLTQTTCKHAHLHMYRATVCMHKLSNDIYSSRCVRTNIGLYYEVQRLYSVYTKII